MDNETVAVKRISKYRAKESALDYEGVDFEKFSIEVGGRRIGEADLQLGKKTVTVRNVIIYDASMTGRGIGKKAYALLRNEFPKHEFRSSYSTNIAKQHENAGLSLQAVGLWQSLERNGQAKKIHVSENRFYFQATTLGLHDNNTQTTKRDSHEGDCQDNSEVGVGKKRKRISPR